MQKPNFGKARPKIELLQSRVLKTMELTMAKVAAHVNSPGTYPLPSDPESPERAIYNLYQVLPKKVKDKFLTKGKAILNAGDAKRKADYGDLMAVDFKSNKSFAEQVKGFQLPSNLKLNETEKKDLKSIIDKNKPAKRTITGKKTTSKSETRGLEPRTLSLFLDSITCQKTVDVLKDEINVEGFFTDAVGNKTVINRFEVGKFKKTQSIAVNRKITDFDLRAAGFFPQNFIAGFLLIDKDLVSNDDLVFKYILASAIICWSAFALFGTLAVLSFAFPPLELAAIIAAVVAGAFYVITYGIAILLDDTSGLITDLFQFDFPPAINVGEKFTRTLNFEISGSVFEKRKGNYTANIHWERSA